jgi:DNA-binding response OmpR family regulator
MFLGQFPRERKMARKLLLADDSITIQKVVELVLAEEGFDIKAVSNGEDALSAAGSFGPDIILADVDMPGMNGYQLCERIKEKPETKGVPVILLAGAFEPIDEELARNVGAEDYIVKPFESQELISKINAVFAAEEMTKEAAPEEAAAEAVELGSEEDLWSMEEVVSEPVAAGEVAESPAEEGGIAETLEFAEEEVEEEAEMFTPQEEPSTAAAGKQEFALPSVEALSKDEVAEIFRKEANKQIASMLSTDIKDSVVSSLAPSIKDSVEKVLWEVAPELAEKLLKELLQGALASLTKEVEKVIWETVPDLAESLISKEIERIKSEM